MRNRLTTGPPTPPSPCCEWSVRVRVPSVPSKSSRGTSSTTNMHTEVELRQPTTRNVKTVQRNDHMGLSSFALLCLAQLRWVQHLAWNPDATPDPRTPQKHPYVLAPMYLLASPHQRTQLSPTCCTMHRYVFKQSMQHRHPYARGIVVTWVSTIWLLLRSRRPRLLGMVCGLEGLQLQRYTRSSVSSRPSEGFVASF
jgi:hypothetical protein